MSNKNTLFIAKKCFANKALNLLTVLNIILFLLSATQSKAQSVTAIASGSCGGTHTLPYVDMLNGKNRFYGLLSVPSPLGGTANINAYMEWTGSQWQVRATSWPVNGQILFTNPTSTTLNPPCYNNGTWTSGGSCAGSTFTGSNGDCEPAAAPLPVILYEFKGQNRRENNILRWRTALEENNKGFEVEISTDGKNWRTVDFIEGTGTASIYVWEDKLPSLKTYYRLKQIDWNGTFEYSKIITVENLNASNEISIYPNPLTNNVLFVKNLKKDNYTAIVYNALGQIVFQQNHQDENDIQLNFGEKLPKGLYKLVIHTQQQIVYHTNIIVGN